MNTGFRRHALRTGTSQAHSELDGMVGALSTRASYERYLGGIAAFRLPLEQAFETYKWPADLGHWRPVGIAAELHADLDDLALDPPPTPPVTLPRSFSGVAGVLYVIEGSALGARLLYKDAQKLGFSADHGARHLARQSADLSQWRSLLDLIEDADPFDLDAATEAAASTFQAAGRAFERHIHVGA